MKWYLLNVLAFWSSMLIAQTPLWQQSKLIIPSNVVSVEFDTIGFMWMTDGQVLYRYDGQQLLPKKSFQDESITCLFSHSDYFVLGTSYGRLLTYNPYDGKMNVIYESQDYKPISGLHYLNENNYAVLSYGNGVRIHIKGNSLHFDNNSGLISNEVYDIAFLNSLYYIATDQGIQIFDSEKAQPLGESLNTQNGLVDMVTTHLEVSNGEIWYTDYDRNIGRIRSRDDIKNFSLSKSSKINGLTSFNNRIYISTNDGLSEFVEGSLNNIFQSKENIKINLSKVDAEGNLWIWTGDNKLYKGSLYFQKMRSKIDNVRAICIYQGDLMFGNESGLFRQEEISTIRISEDNITHLAVYKNYLLVGTFSEGVKVYDRNMNMISSIKKWSKIGNQSVLYIYVDKENVYVSSLSGVMQFTVENGQLIPQNSLNSIIGMGYIYTILVHHDRMYFGTDRKGLVIWDKARDEIEKIVEFDTGGKIGSVYAMTIDKQDKLWFTSTSKGLGTLKYNTAIIIENLPDISDEYTSLTSLRNGDLLAIRSKSTDLLDPESHYFMLFDKELGLEDEIAFLNTIAQDSNNIYFVHNQTIFSYRPDSIFKIFPQVLIDKVLVNLAEVESKNSFKQNENNIEFFFSSSWLTDPSKLLYQYRMLGFNNEWRKTKDRFVAYPKLSPGKYEFQVRASKNGYFDKEPLTNYEFEIKKYFYNRWWAKLTGLAILVFVVWKLIKARELRRKEKLELEKLNVENQLINLKNQLNPHFLFNAFNTLVGLIEEDSERSILFIERMTDFYRNMLEYGKKDLISLSVEKTILEQYIDILKARFNGQLDIIIDISEDTDLYQIPPMTLQLLVENAVKHNVVSSKRPLKINIIQKGKKLIVSNVKELLIRKSFSAKVGLSNIEKRFQLVDLPAPVINDRKDIFEIIIQLKK